MATVLNPDTGQLAFVDDPAGLVAQGWRVPSPEEADRAARELDANTLGQQAQAQGERVVRVATLGAVRGFGSPEEIQTRADVSEREHPALSFAADVAPQVALGALAATGVGAVAEGLGAAAGGTVAGTAALAGESAAGGLVGAAQSAFERGQYLGDDPGKDAENALIFGGLNFGLGAVTHALFGSAGEAGKQISRFATEGEDGTAASLADVAKVAERGAADVAAPAAEGAVAAPVSLAGKSLEDLKALPIEGEGDLAAVQALKDHPGFAETGRVPGNDAAGGITLVNDAGDLVLRDGRHRLQAAQDLGRDSVFGRYVDGETGQVLFEGEIPLKDLPAPAPAGAEAAAARQATRDAVDDGMDRALAKASRSEADDIVEKAVGSPVPTPEADSFGRQRRLYQNRQAILDASTREMQTDLTDLMADVPAIARGGKIQDVSRNVGENISAQRAVSDGIAKNAAELAGTLRGEARAYAASLGKDGLQYAVKGTKDLVTTLTDSAQALADAETGPAMFEAADAFKRALQDHKLSLEAGSLNALNPKAFQDMVPKVQTFASQIRTALEDPAVWGKAGDMQKAYNSVISDQLMPSMQVFEDAVLKRTSKDYDALWRTEGWESKISSLLKGNDLGKVRHVNAVLDSLDQLASVRKEYGDAAIGQRMADRVAKIRRTLGLANEVQDATARMQAIGSVAGHAPLVGGLAKEWVTGDLASAFRQLSGAVDQGIDRGVDDWIASSRLRADSGSLLGNVAGAARKAVTSSGESSAIAQIASRQGISHGLARFMGEDSSPQAAFERARAALQSDETFFQAMGQDYKSLQQQSPETYLMLSGRAAQLRSFLLQRMPANVSVSMMRPGGYPPSRDAIEDWSIYWNAARDPMSVVCNVGSARIQELQTLQVGYPRLYERLQQRVIEKVGAAQTAGAPLGDALLMRLNLLFNLDGVASPAFSRQVGQMARDYNAAQQQAPGQQGSSQAAKPNPALMPGPVQGVAQNGATFGSG